ncbi:MAG: argininosuccinate synthase [Gammaproteobacteria bacterium]
MKKIVLAFSGGLDTSFCVPYLIDKGFEVHTIFVNTGGISKNTEKQISNKSKKLGAKKHHSVNVETKLWQQILTPLIWSGSLYQGKYPVLCSDRYLIVSEAVNLCNKLKTNLIAHGCTGMGNDQVRFDMSIKALGNYEIVSPIREIQAKVSDVRNYEIDFLKGRGHKISSSNSKYSINENLMGVTISGSEIDKWQEPKDQTYVLCNKPNKYPSKEKKISIDFFKGIPKKLNGKSLKGSELLKILNKEAGKYGVGRDLYTGDTIIGIKGRILFESPGIAVLMSAHKALEDAVFTNLQNSFKTNVGEKWVELVYKGFYFDPLIEDLESFLENSQKSVSGRVTLLLSPGKVESISVESKKILQKKDAIYAQSASWDEKESLGFIKLYGQSTATWRGLNKK